MIVLTIQNLHKAFGGNTVLKDVNLTLQDHQRMGLVGVNGCGKPRCSISWQAGSTRTAAACP